MRTAWIFCMCYTCIERFAMISIHFKVICQKHTPVSDAHQISALFEIGKYATYIHIYLWTTHPIVFFAIQYYICVCVLNSNDASLAPFPSLRLIWIWVSCIRLNWSIGSRWFFVEPHPLNVTNGWSRSDGGGFCLWSTLYHWIITKQKLLFPNP